MHDEVVGARVLYEPTEEEVAAARKIVDDYWRGKSLSDTPALLSILYDIDLLPEQIRLPVNAVRMIAFCEVFKKLSPDDVASLFSSPETPEGEKS